MARPILPSSCKIYFSLTYVHVVYSAADVSHVPSGAVGEDVDDDDVPGMELDSSVALIFPFG